MKTLFAAGSFGGAGSGPLYLQLQRRISDAIASGVLTPDDRLPAERDLAQMMNLSRVTVRKALQSLVARGQLVQRRGSGTFVAERVQLVEPALAALTSFTEDMLGRGKVAESVWIKRALFSPSPEEVMALGLGSENLVARLERVRRCDGLPIAIERAALSNALLPDPESVDTSLYALLQERGFKLVRAVQRISAASLGIRDAELLGVNPGTASLKIERISYLASGRVVEFTRSVYRSDAYEVAVELKIANDVERNA